MTAESPPPDLQLRDALGSFMTGVTIVTTRTADGENRGMTANSFSSVSLSPPLVSVCIGRRAGGFSAFADGGGFAVSVLAENQGDLAAFFPRAAATDSPTENGGMDSAGRFCKTPPLGWTAKCVINLTVATI